MDQEGEVMGWGKYRGLKGQLCESCRRRPAEMTYKPNVSHSFARNRHYCAECIEGGLRVVKAHDDDARGGSDG